MSASSLDGCRLFLHAASFAARAHQGQVRKDGKTPYVSHVFRVCLIVRDQFGFSDPRMLATALLHDTIEDTTTDFDDLEEHFGAEIAQWVALLTKDKSKRDDIRERDYIEKLLGAPWQVRACKLADLFDNLLDLGQMPAGKRSRSLSRYTAYFEALKASPESELREPLASVCELLRTITVE